MINKIIFYAFMGLFAVVITYVYILDVLGAETFMVFLVAIVKVLPYFLLLGVVAWVMRKRLFKK